MLSMLHVIIYNESRVTVKNLLNRSRETVCSSRSKHMVMHVMSGQSSILAAGSLPRPFRSHATPRTIRGPLMRRLSRFAAPRLYCTMYSAPRRVVVVGPSPRAIVDVEPVNDEILEVVAKRSCQEAQGAFCSEVMITFHDFFFGGMTPSARLL